MQPNYTQYRRDPTRYTWLWDTDMTNERFDECLTQSDISSYEAQWAMLRIIEYASFFELKRLLPKKRFVEMWPNIARRVRAREDREGMEFCYQRFLQNGDVHG